MLDQFCFVKVCEDALVWGDILGTINSFPPTQLIPIKATLKRGTRSIHAELIYDYPDGIEFIKNMMEAIKNRYQLN